MNDAGNSGMRNNRSLLRHLPLTIILIAAVVGYFSLRDYLTFDTLRANREALLAFRDAHFLLMLPAFMGIYFLIVAFSLPGSAVASVTGGFLFGLLVGTTASVTAASLGAMTIFLATRWGLGQILAARLDTSEGTIKRLKNNLHENEVSVLFLMRLVPVVPFFMANLIPALVGVKFRNFALTTILGIIPGGLVFTWIGVGLGEIFDRGENPNLSLLWEPQIMGPLLGLSALAALPIIIKALRGKRSDNS